MGHMSEPTTRFVGQPITPVAGTADIGRMAMGEPGIPRRFLWNDQEHEVAEVLDAAKRYDDCTHGSGEQYLRKHVYVVRTTRGDEMKLSFLRQPRSPAQRKQRWWLQSIVEAS